MVEPQCLLNRVFISLNSQSLCRGETRSEYKVNENSGISVPVVFTVMSRQTPLGFEKSLANIAVRGRTPRLLVFRCNVPEKSVLRGERYTAFIAERSW